MSDMTTERERNEPTPDELIEILELLVGAAEAGQLVSLTWMLQDPRGKAVVVDYRGSFEMSELACRTVRDRIAKSIQHEHPLIAGAINVDIALHGKH